MRCSWSFGELVQRLLMEAPGLSLVALHGRASGSVSGRPWEVPRPLTCAAYTPTWEPGSRREWRQYARRPTLRLSTWTWLAPHGHTLWHIPRSAEARGATFQIGDPATIAECTALPVVSVFPRGRRCRRGPRSPPRALAGRLLFSVPARGRALQNLGGIGERDLATSSGIRRASSGIRHGPWERAARPRRGAGHGRPSSLRCGRGVRRAWRDGRDAAGAAAVSSVLRRGATALYRTRGCSAPR